MTIYFESVRNAHFYQHSIYIFFLNLKTIYQYFSMHSAHRKLNNNRLTVTTNVDILMNRRANTLLAPIGFFSSFYDCAFLPMVGWKKRGITYSCAILPVVSLLPNWVRWRTPCWFFTTFLTRFGDWQCGPVLMTLRLHFVQFGLHFSFHLFFQIPFAWHWVRGVLKGSLVCLDGWLCFERNYNLRTVL